jgi:hypothetical protein
MLKSELIKSFIGFLKAEAEEQNMETEVDDDEDKQGPVDISVLIGNKEDLGDKGIGSSLMQLYVPYIIECMLDPKDVALSQLSFQLVELILDQGSEHPLTVQIFTLIQVSTCFSRNGNTP